MSEDKINVIVKCKDVEDLKDKNEIVKLFNKKLLKVILQLEKRNN